MPNCVNVAINTVPALLFFSAYIVLLCFWCDRLVNVGGCDVDVVWCGRAEMYSHSQPHKSETRSSPTGRKLIIVYWVVNIVMWFAFILLFALDIQYASSFSGG